MICLGIESTAHTFGIGIVDAKGNILADVKDMYKPLKGGIIPNESAKHHKEVADKILDKALKQAKLAINKINVIAYSQGPGLNPCLIAGRDFAIELSKENEIPLIGVNHIAGHLEIGKLLTKAKDPVFVFTSGANTQIIAHEGKKFRVFGEALSVGLGNALDKFGRALGLPFPAGPEIEKLAKKGKYIELPYVVKGMDVEFSGIVTNVIQKYSKGASKEDLCYSLQETGFAMLTEVSERAVAHTNKKEVLLIGGVAANQRLCKMMDIMCKERKAKFYPCPLKYSGDNGVQIAVQGLLEFKHRKDQKDFDIKPRWRIDQVDTIWLK
jgi:bifunctional N6-L-threonylcarbamoyladenine synthase / protein kinase Bud32